MWFFQCANNSFYYFWEKSNYSIGRKNNDIIISNDESISRNHALLEIDYNTVYLTDKGSKYGTFVNEAKLKPNEKHKLKEKDQIKFGLLDNAQSKFELEKLNMCVVTSNVKSTDKKELHNALEFLHANRIATWNKSCTHLVVSEVILTAKVLCALTEEQPIVTAKYFQDYMKSVKKNLKPPNARDYLPEINETLLSKKIKLEYNPNRRTLFQNKTFVFLTEKCKVQMAELITVTGGKAISWEKNKLNVDILKKDSTSYIFLEENIDDINQNSEMYKSFSKCVKLLSESGKRSIPLQEIALAIVYNSCEENCNPLFNRVALLLVGNTPSTQCSEPILVYDTEHISATSTQKDSQMSNEMQNIVVMPSYDSINISSIPSNSYKRPLDLDSSDEKPQKKSKEETKTKQNAHEEYTKKQNAQDDSTISNLFSFKRSSSASSFANASKNSAFNFPLPTSTPKKKPSEEEQTTDENPFTRKRKATKEAALKPTTKKQPLENISNIEKSNIKPISVLAQNNSNVSFKSEMSTIIKSKTWLSKTIMKKEISNGEPEDEPKIKIENDLDDILKLNEQFKNSIVIEFMPLVIKKEENISFANTNEKNPFSQVNFKKFKKNNVANIQTIIITDDQMSRFVVGSAISNDLSDDDVQETPEMDMIDKQPVGRYPAPKRARFQFGV